MKMYHCLIVEDSEPYSLLVKSYLNQLPFFGEITLCHSGAEALTILNSQEIDLLFLDIELPQLSGINLLKCLPESKLPPTILISSYSDYAIESYELGKAIDFLKKPFTFDRCLLAINRALSVKISNSTFADKEFILLKKGRMLQKFYFDQISFIESYGIYTKIHLDNQVEVVNENLTTLETKLNNKKFVRVHKSYIINLDKISHIDSKQFWTNGFSVPIGRHYKPQFESLFKLFEKKDAESNYLTQ